jgi:hypothetical protein
LPQAQASGHPAPGVGWRRNNKRERVREQQELTLLLVGAK